MTLWRRDAPSGKESPEARAGGRDAMGDLVVRDKVCVCVPGARAV